LAVELSEEERKKLQTELATLSKESMQAFSEQLSMLIRALDGRPVETDDVISKLIKLKQNMERSRFPTYPLLAKQVYLRLIAKYNKQGAACEAWADFEASALIAYKGLNWDAYVEMVKATSTPQEQQSFYMGPTTQQPTQPQVQQKRHFWQGQPKPKQEPSEFVNQ
jgi:hypothetical protein